MGWCRHQHQYIEPLCFGRPSVFFISGGRVRNYKRSLCMQVPHSFVICTVGSEVNVCLPGGDFDSRSQDTHGGARALTPGVKVHMVGHVDLDSGSQGMPARVVTLTPGVNVHMVWQGH